MPDITMGWIQSPEGEALVAAAAGMVPRLRELAAKTDADRRVPDETFQAFQDAGLYRAFKPKRYGGLQLSVFDHAMIAMELGRGCASSAWIFSLLNEHSWFISLFPEAAQEEIWGTNPQSCSAGSIRPDAKRSKVELVEGGYRLSGQFSFTSGSDHADWILLAAFKPATDGAPPQPHFFLTPKRQLTIVDDWFVLGMRGTGSRTCVAENVFIPTHRAVPSVEIMNARPEGAAAYPDWPLLKAARVKVPPFVTAAPIVGTALGAVETFLELARETSRRGKSIADSNSIQLKLSESAADADAARVIVRSDAQEVSARLEAGLPISDELSVRLTRDAAYVALLSQRCVDRLFTALGSSAIFVGHPNERAMRDVHAAMAQVSVQWEVCGIPYADYMLNQTWTPPTGVPLKRADSLPSREPVTQG